MKGVEVEVQEAVRQLEVSNFAPVASVGSGGTGGDSGVPTCSGR